METTITTVATSVAIWWDTQDPQSEGWTWRVWYSAGDGYYDSDSGQVDAPRDAELADLLELVAADTVVDLGPYADADAYGPNRNAEGWEAGK